jgi:hypothetical protein
MIFFYFYGVIVTASLAPSDRISDIKRGLLSEHRSTWGDILSHGNVPLPSIGRDEPSVNLTAISEAARRSDDIAWQWGFWPFTSIDDDN